MDQEHRFEDEDRFRGIERFRIPDISGFRPPPGAGRMVLAALAGVVLLIILWGSFYQVEPEEVGLVLRFGRHVRTTEPGLRFKIPLLEAVIKVPVQRQLKQELGLGHYEGRGWRGFHHHATLCIAAYGFLMAERNRLSPSACAGHVGLSAPELPPDFRPRGSPRPPRTA